MTSASPVDRLNDPVTQHMRTDYARLHPEQTIAGALEALRQQAPGGRIIYLYVVDDENKLQGVVPTRRLLLNAPDKAIGEIMVRDAITIPARASVLEACEFFIMHRLLAFPVVNENRELQGVVDVELYTDELHDLDRRAESDELFQLIGVHLEDARQRTPWGAFWSRFPWLLTNVVGGILAAILSGFFEVELQKAVALALFIPVVLALAESVSFQSVSLTLQSLRGKHPTLRAILKKLRFEAAVGSLLGVVCGLAVALVALLWLGDWLVVWCILGGIAGGVLLAAVIGMALPNLLRYFRCDPQVAAGPIALAVIDMISLLIYFLLARWLLG